MYIGLGKKRTTGLAQSYPYILTTNNWIIGIFIAETQPKTKKAYDNYKINNK